MAVVREEHVTFQAECEGCGARGPMRTHEAGAVEAVTTEVTANRTGISLLGRWRYVRGSLFCPGCAGRVYSQTRDRP
jgi:hypothetical protein